MKCKQFADECIELARGGQSKLNFDQTCTGIHTGISAI